MFTIPPRLTQAALLPLETLFLIVLATAALAQDAGPGPVEFNRAVRPILSDKCFACHGPDSAQRKADLRLDQRESATRGEPAAIVPGRSAQSEAYRRMISTDADLQMPPPGSGWKVSPAEIETVRRWIDAGAEYQPHWSFLPPRPVVPPAVAEADGQPRWTTRQPVDSFIQSVLAREGLEPSPDADRATLLRRTSFDVTGLPPTPADVAEFLADNSPDAYERLLDRLQASPRFGERMATPWLDAARYADTNGYQTDGPRFMWRWRDWVIDALNSNMPFDEFTLDQIAGDLRESSPSAGRPTIADARLIATGFHRNHRGNAEGGIIPEEFRIEYVVDRVETTAAVWMGLTLGCARCHDHKYDPFSQREFYQLFACFNQVPEPGKYIRNSNSMPYLPAPTPEQQRHLTALQQERDRALAAWASLQPEVDAGLQTLAAQLTRQPVRDVVPQDHLESEFLFNSDWAGTTRDRQGRPQSVSFTPHAEVSWAPGAYGQAAVFAGRGGAASEETGDFGEDESFAVSVWVRPAKPEVEQGAMTLLARMDHENSSRGYELRREANGRLQVLLAGRILDDLIRVEAPAPLPEGEWSHVWVSYDGSSAARGVRVRINGESQSLEILTDLLSNPIRVKTPLVVGAGGSAAPFSGAIDDLRTFRGLVSDETALAFAARETLTDIAARHPKVPATSLAKFRDYYLTHHAPAAHRNARQAVRTAEIRLAEFLATVPTTMVMEDQRATRPTFLLKRGEYDKPADRVEAALPAALQAGATTPAVHNRLDLAEWLVSPANPLTARVTVNRVWQSLFGVGIVKTAEDFGTQGEAPSHPDLLDWLARDFAGTGGSGQHRSWDLKRLQRMLMTSATYRQSAAVAGPSAARDPDNRWLARGPRFRLPAEMIRDAALASSGLLVETLGGPSVKPYQPPGLWEELSAEAMPGPFAVYVQDHGASLYRRGLYTYRKRTVPPPSLALFDASPRETCRVSLPRTNTPLQALNLMNDVTYLEAARVLAERSLREGGTTAAAQTTWLFQQILSREPTAHELTVLLDGFQRRRHYYETHPHDAQALSRVGEAPRDPTASAPDVAAALATASVLLNLDEFVTRP